MRWRPPSAATCWRSTWRGCGRLAPGHVRIGLSATVARPSELRAYLMPQTERTRAIALADLVDAEGGAPGPTSAFWRRRRRCRGPATPPAMRVAEIYAAIKAHQLSLVFVNTRSQAELLFQELWRINDDGLPIALHHGSLDAARRRKVEAAMAAGTLKAVVATSTLDLGIDWGDVDLVINVGAPKGASRLIQRVGRANHRLDEPSQAAAGAVQPLRGAGMPRRDRSRRGRRPGRRAEPHRRARRAGPARSGAPPAPVRSMPDELYARCAPPRPTPT